MDEEAYESVNQQGVADMDNQIDQVITENREPAEPIIEGKGEVTHDSTAKQDGGWIEQVPKPFDKRIFNDVFRVVKMERDSKGIEVYQSPED
ncbi:MAG TPA: hypothetical protein VMN77_00150 [Nitrospiria bacterium]|nr:hypothetical protein [Nitrospiria bacterium]